MTITLDRFARAAALLGLACLTACRSEAGRAPVSLDDFPEELAEVSCAYGVRCCVAPGDSPERYADLDACVESGALQLRTSYADVRAALRDGELAWDDALAAECLEQLERAPCGLSFRFESGPCVENMIPLLREGSACRTSRSCIDGDCIDGRCVRYRAGGELCDVSTGRFCGPGFECIDGLCSVPLRDGSECSTDSECRSFTCEGGTCVAAQPVCAGPRA